MLIKIFSVLAAVIGGFAIFDAYTQKSAFILGQEKQPNYSPRYGTNLSGGYNPSRIWIYNSATRNYYQDFQGGGPSRGK